MSTEEIKMPVLVSETFRKNKGPFQIIAVITALVTVAMNLPDDYVSKLHDRWMVITVPTVFYLIASLGYAYLVEQRNRTKVEQKIYDKLEILTGHFESMFAKQLDNQIYLDKSFDKVGDEHKAMNDRLDGMTRVLEKRKDILHTQSGETEKFLNKK